MEEKLHDLSDVTTDELWEELKRRHDALVYFGQAKARKDDIFGWQAQGNIKELMWMIEIGKALVIRTHFEGGSRPPDAS